MKLNIDHDSQSMKHGVRSGISLGVTHFSGNLSEPVGTASGKELLLCQAQRKKIASGVRRPNPLVFRENVAENWHKFEVKNEILIASAHSPPVYILLSRAGTKAIWGKQSFTYAPVVMSVQDEVMSREVPKCLKK